MDISKASGRGVCSVCRMKIPKGEKQLLIDVKRYKFLSTQRYCKSCGTILLDNLSNNLKGGTNEI